MLSGCRVEPALAAAPPGTVVQFERTGYFCMDARDSSPGQPVGLRDTCGKMEKAAG